MSALLKQNTPEWLKLRKSKIGASDASVIMQVNPWKTPMQLWQQKIGITNDDQVNSAMQRGLDLEPVARIEFHKITGINVDPIVMFHNKIDYMMASMDGINIEKKIAVEIKVPGFIDHEQAMDGVIPEKYIPQLQHQMEVCGLDSMFYFSFNEKNSKIIEIHRDDEYIEKLLEKEKDFYECMQKKEPPQLIEKDFIIRKDQEWKEASQAWLEANYKLNSLSKKEEEARRRLIELCGNSNCMGSGVRICKTTRKGSVDYKSIDELKNVDLDKYRKSAIESWRLQECKQTCSDLRIFQV
jgi:putative phage-type endonuclease